MKQTKEIKALEMVRKIRDSISKELAHKSPDEIIAYFNRAGGRAKSRPVRARVKSKSLKAARERRR